MMKSDELIEVAKLGKVVGLDGYIKLHNLSDFAEQFKKNASFLTNKQETLTIEKFDNARGIVKFVGISDRDTASKYVNTILQTTIQKTKEQIKLNKDEFFWFDIVGSFVIEDDKMLGVVEEIERIGAQDYFKVKTDESYDKNSYLEYFLVPYIDRYVLEVDIENRKIFTKDAKYFLDK